jgi:hypothetical protein
MRGPCAHKDCFAGAEEELTAAPCSNCAKPVHHICSNDIHDGEISVRLCSVECAFAFAGKEGEAGAATQQGNLRTEVRKPVGAGKAAAHRSGVSKRPPASSSTDNGSDGEEKPTGTRNKFYFSPDMDLALLKEVINVRPFAAEHGKKGERFAAVTEHLNEHLEEVLGAKPSLSVRTVKERFGLLIKEFTASDAQYRRRSGVAEDYKEQQQLLQDITSQMKDFKDAKEAKKGQKKPKADRLETHGEQLREAGRKR